MYRLQMSRLAAVMRPASRVILMHPERIITELRVSWSAQIHVGWKLIKQT